jgi:hypothetical protein
MKKYNGVIKAKSKSDIRIRIFTSIFILALIVPFLVFGSLPQMDNYGYNMFFNSVLLIGFSYGMMELVEALLPFNIKGNVLKFHAVFIPALIFPFIFG